MNTERKLNQMERLGNGCLIIVCGLIVLFLGATLYLHIHRKYLGKTFPLEERVADASGTFRYRPFEGYRLIWDEIRCKVEGDVKIRQAIYFRQNTYVFMEDNTVYVMDPPAKSMMSVEFVDRWKGRPADYSFPTNGPTWHVRLKAQDGNFEFRPFSLRTPVWHAIYDAIEKHSDKRILEIVYCCPYTYVFTENDAVYALEMPADSGVSVKFVDRWKGSIADYAFPTNGPTQAVQSTPTRANGAAGRD